MKPFQFLILLLFPAFCIAQVRGTILNNETQEHIPYANISIENTVVGTTSDVNGNFHFKEMPTDIRLFISSVGFENQSISVSDSVIQVFLKPKTYEIGLITVKPGKNPKTLQIHKIPSHNCSNHLVCSSYPWMSARYFEYNPEYQLFSKIKELKVLTHSEITGSKFNIRIISPNDKGEPTEDLIGENIIVTSKKGNHITTINIEDLNLKFPESGLFIVLEWLVIDENKYNFTYSMRGEKFTRNEVRYDPKFGAFPRKGTLVTWSYSGGKWTKTNFQKSTENGDYLDLAIELTLTE